MKRPSDSLTRLARCVELAGTPSTISVREVLEWVEVLERVVLGSEPAAFNYSDDEWKYIERLRKLEDWP